MHLIYSMTGYGKAEANINNILFNIEVKSLNSKGADVNIKIPFMLKPHESIIRQTLSQHLKRGYIECNISAIHSLPQASINIQNVKYYIQQFQSLADELQLPKENLLHSVLALPNMMQQSDIEITNQDLFTLKNAIEQAINNLFLYRQNEGLSLQQDIITHLYSIQQDLNKINELAPLRIEEIKNNIKIKLQQWLKDTPIDTNRFEQELFYYIEKIDINEETKRLQHHLDYFNTIMQDKQNIDSKGKQLGFIAQEFMREANTIGSKANYTPIQRLVINIKNAIEKIKEQINNIL